MKITITKKTAKLFVSDDPLRPAIRGVYYDAERSVLVMTNGFILAAVPVEDGLAESCIIPVDALPEKAGATSDVSLADGKLTVERRDKKGADLGTLALTPIEEPYPKWAQLFEHLDPEKEGLTEPIALDPNLLAAFSSLAKNLGAEDHYARLTFYGANCACKVELALPVYGLIMPVRK